MSWAEFKAWLDALKRRSEVPESDPYSWKGAASDPWWEQARAHRDAQRGR